MLKIIIHNIDVTYVKDEEKKQYFIAIKPICEILGIDHVSQRKVLKSHPIYSSGVVMNTTPAADGKSYPTLCISEKFVLSWLLGIDIRRVNDNSKSNVFDLQMECHDVLHRHFVGRYVEEIELIERKEQLDRESKKVNDDLKRVQRARREGVYTIKRSST